MWLNSFLNFLNETEIEKGENFVFQSFFFAPQLIESEISFETKPLKWGKLSETGESKRAYKNIGKFIL